MLIHAASVSRTLDSVNGALFARKKLPGAERTRVAKWLAARQGLPGAYGDTFAGFDSERKNGIVLFTGERITSAASARHVLGEEACRALRLLGVRDRIVQAALDRANAGLLVCLNRAERDPRNDNPGRYCCCKCSVGMWRNLLSGGLDRRDERLRHGVRLLRSARDGEGRWRAFPFWYTVLTLTEIDGRDASRELTYAAPLLERAARRTPSSDTFARRRHELAGRALART